MSTPGPRKFLPASGQFKTPKPTWRVPKRPPSNQFAKTPRFATSSDHVDDIDVSFEERRSSPSGVKAQTAASKACGGYDYLRNEDDEIELHFHPSKARRLKHEEDEIDGLELPGAARSSTRLGDSILDIEEDEFLRPTSKRLKRSSKSTRHHEAILISPSGSEDNHRLDIDRDEHEHKPRRLGDPFDLDSDFDDDFPSSPSHIRTSTSTIPRFRVPSAPSSDLPSTKPIFKPPLPSQIASNTAPLPDTFSPSRRRGKRDYVPAGYADTVRNWVLELSTSLSKPSSAQSNGFRITRIHHDSEGRCATVLDEQGREWLLVSQDQSHQSATSLSVGDCVEMGVEGTSWVVDVGAGSAGMEGAEGEVQAGRSVNVGVLWKVVR